MGNSPLLQLIQVLPEVPSKLAYSIQAGTRSSGSLRTRVGINQLEQAVSPRFSCEHPGQLLWLWGSFSTVITLKLKSDVKGNKK